METCDMSGVVEGFALFRIMFGAFMVQVGILIGIIALQ